MLVIKNANVIFTDKIRKAIVLCDNGKIKDIVEHYTEGTGDNIIDANGLYLSPGFIDIHVHGGGNKSAMSTDYNDIIKMAEAHLKYGTTSIVPTTLASPIEQLKNVTLSIKEASEKSKKANILGLHYEGPYISLKYKGAQSPENILNPVKNPPDELFSLWDKILIMGAAPEEDGCLELGDKLRKRNIVASIAHSAASYEKVEEAIKHGYSDVTHIYNACTSCFKEGIFRVAGVVEAGLTIDEITTQVIGDLRHLPKGLLKLIYKTKGVEKMYLITDGLEFAASDIKENTVYTQENGMGVIFEDGAMKLADRSALAGSVATLKDCVRNMYKTVNVPLYEAVRMATLTPAEVIGFNKTKGKIEKGYDADFVLFDDDINIKTVITNGNII
ncbi:MAG: N-acetylglucosamine-6-phosphate deacetylase [Ruminococcaceae bacterium]|nr:N-acetylglucosamine-6-phosphate deacetylase [Oscillospiraceae bacterium]